MRRAVLLFAVLGGILSLTTAAHAFDSVQSLAIALSKQERFQAPEGWSWGYLTNADGARLRYGRCEAGNSRGTIALLSGFRSTAEEFFEDARDFRALGYNVWILDWRGQGGSDRWIKGSEKTVSAGLDHDEHDLEQFITLISQREHGPIYIAAESFGGDIALRMLHDTPGRVAAAALSSPAIVFRTGNLSPTFVRWTATAAVYLGFGNSYGSKQSDWAFDSHAGSAGDPVNDNRDHAQAMEGFLLTHPSERQGGATWSYIYQFYRSSDLMQQPGWMAGIRTPVLMGVVKGDQVADDEVMLSSCHAMQHCAPMIFTGTRHALFSDRDEIRTRFIRAIAAFFASHPSTEEKPR